MIYNSKLVLLLLAIVSGVCITQTQAQVFNIAFEHDFEQNTLGEYNHSEWSEDWNKPSWANHDVGFGEIKQEGDNKYLSLKFPAGTFFFEGSGWQWQALLDRPYDELYLTYRIRFSEGFIKQELHSKLPGFSGKNSNAGGHLPTGSDGWSARYMFKKGLNYFYLYHPEIYKYFGDSEPDPNTTYWGESVRFNTDELKPDTWYVFTQRIVMNTPGSHNGLVEGYLNNKLVARRTGLRFRDISSLAIDRIYFSVFLGGSGVEPTKDEYIHMDDFYAYAYSNEIDVPRGSESSPSNRQLILPFDNSFDAYWQTNVRATAQSTSRINLSWTLYNEAVSYKIERKKQGESSFQQIATLSSTQNSYSDLGLDVGTSYVYRISAGSQTSIEKTATTFEGVVPAAPSSLAVGNLNANLLLLRWEDNSSLEKGYYLEQSVGNNTSFSRIASITANTTSYSVTSLIPATNFYYRLRAYNDFGNSTYSNTINVTTDAIVMPPLGPTNIVFQSVNPRSIRIGWSDKADNESIYHIERSPNSPNDFTLLAERPANTQAFTDDHINDSTRYYYRVRAVNSGGNSGYSSVIDTVVPEQAPPPNAPSYLSFAFVPNAEIRIIWKDNSDNEAMFYIERAIGNQETFNEFKQVPANITYTTDIEFEENIRYAYRIRAYSDEGGFSQYSNIIDTILTYNAVDLIPETPSDLKLSDRSESSISLVWSDNSKSETGFLVQRGQYPDYTLVDYLSVPANQTQFEDQGLEAGKTYVYSVSARSNSLKSAHSNKVTAYTMSLSEKDRTSEGLLALYNFKYDPERIVRDISLFSEPADISADEIEDANWKISDKLTISNGSALKSNLPSKKISDRCRLTNEISIEIWVKTHFIEGERTSRIFSLENEEGIGFALDCSSSSTKPGEITYSALLTTESTNKYGYPELKSSHSVESDVLHHVVYTFDNEGNEKLYVNNEIIAEGYRVPVFSNWGDDYNLLIANNFSLNMPWEGELYLSSVFDRALTEEEVYTNFLASPFNDAGFKLNPDNFFLVAYPNPTSSVLSIEVDNQDLNSDITNSYYISITSQNGLVYVNDRISKIMSGGSLDINISNLPAGLYNVILYNKNKIIDTKRISVIK